MTKYQILSLKVKTKAVDALVFHLGEIGIDSVEIVDNNISDEDLASMYVNINGLDDSDSEYSEVRAYFDEAEDVDSYIAQIKERVAMISEFIDVGDFELALEQKEDDYLNNWKQYYKVVEALDFAIVPEWESYDGDKEIIKIEPAYAFGSGSHETTRLCLEMMQTVDMKGKLLADIGCGSGILSIAAHKLGADRVVAVDIDEMAIKSSENNLSLNEINTGVDLVLGNLLDNVDESFDIIVSNIILPVLASMKEDIKKALKQGGTLILSGILASQEKDFAEIFGKDFKIVELHTLGEWQGVILKYE